MARQFSGMQATGEMHLGNYIGAVSRWVADQDDSIFCIVDLHSMTVPYKAEELREATRRLATLLLAAGLDPQRCILFLQSHVPAHSECAWILNNIATFGELRRMTQFKEKSGGQESVSVGLFDYPVLMAADMLLYNPKEIPVGEDQRQHIELTRDIATRFNNRFGETFVVPKATFASVGARVMDLQNPTAKMSKTSESPQGTIGVLDPPEAILKKVKTAVTDSGSDIAYDPEKKPGISNLLEIYAVATGKKIPETVKEFDGQGYGGLKTTVGEAIVEFLRPVRERYEQLSQDPGEVDRIYAVGAEKAKAISEPVLARVKKNAGLLLPQ